MMSIAWATKEECNYDCCPRTNWFWILAAILGGLLLVGRDKRQAKG